MDVNHTDYTHHLDVAGITAAQRGVDARIAGACIRAGQPERIEEMLTSVWTFEQVQAELLRQPAPATGQGGAVASLDAWEAAGREVFARRFAPAAASPTSSTAPSRRAPAQDRVGQFGGRPGWP